MPSAVLMPASLRTQTLYPKAADRPAVGADLCLVRRAGTRAVMPAPPGRRCIWAVMPTPPGWGRVWAAVLLQSRRRCIRSVMPLSPWRGCVWAIMPLSSGRGRVWAIMPLPLPALRRSVLLRCAAAVPRLTADCAPALSLQSSPLLHKRRLYVCVPFMSRPPASVGTCPCQA